MACTKCSDLWKSIGKTEVVSGGGAYPSTLELAYMVNLEYYADINIACVHKIPENNKANISIKEMVKFIDDAKWELGTRTSYKGFKSSTFINRPKKQVVIVHRGTENWSQVKTDIMLALEVVSKEDIEKADWHITQTLLNNCLKEERGKFVRNDFSVTVTGHSLGGWLSQVCTLLRKYPTYFRGNPRGKWSFGNGMSVDLDQPYDLHCVAFDSPGAKSILRQLDLSSKVACWLQGRKRDIEDALGSLDVTNYLSNRNVVNCCGDHIGTVKRMDVMENEWFWNKMNPIASHSMERILAYLKLHQNF